MNTKKSNKKYFIGVDLHSNQFTCCFLDNDNRREYLTFPVSDTGISDFINTSRKQSNVIIEASTGTFEFVYRIRDHFKNVYVANPHKLRLISMVNKKTDKVDAEKLALFLKMQILSGEELIKPVHIPGRTIKELRSLFTTYKSLSKIVIQIKNSIHSLYKQNLICISKNKLAAKTKRHMFLKVKEKCEWH